MKRIAIDIDCAAQRCVSTKSKCHLLLPAANRKTRHWCRAFSKLLDDMSTEPYRCVECLAATENHNG